MHIVRFADADGAVHIGLSDGTEVWASGVDRQAAR
jgi:hypothetical protein